MRKVFVKRPVSDKGYIWESQLWSKGFNELLPSQQFGEVIEDGLYPFRVFWPALEFETALIYADEVSIEEVS